MGAAAEGSSRRAPLRNGFERWEELTPGEPVKLTINLRPTANVFLPGHRVRLEISSSNLPRYDRNLNTPGAGTADKTEMKIADQQVFHDPKRPSKILLPVLE